MDIKMDFERRDSDRLARVFPVLLSGQDQERLETHALDVSRTGVRILCPRALPEGDALQLTLELEPELRLSFQGRPVWQQELNRAGQHMVGLCFVPCEGDQADLGRWLEEQRAA